MKEDILEQVVTDYLESQGYFTVHNVKFRPDPGHPDYSVRADSVPSDMDVIGVNPKKRGHNRVIVASCKSSQGGFDPGWWLKRFETGRNVSGKKPWKHFRELCRPKWAEAMMAEVARRTGTREFAYWLVVTRLDGDASAWEQHQPFRAILRGNPLKVMELRQLVASMAQGLTTTPAPSQLGRLLQVIQASGGLPG